MDIIVHLSRLRDHSRRTMTISEVLPGLDADGNVRLNPLYQFYEDESSTVKTVSGRLTRTQHRMTQVEKLLRAGYTGKDIPAPNPEAELLERRMRQRLQLDGEEMTPDA